MKRMSCDREFELARALQAASVSGELRTHMLDCATCRETGRLVQLLVPYAAAIRDEAANRIEGRLPSASILWRRAQAQRKEQALRRATRGLVYMGVLGTGYALLLIFWLLHRFWNSQYLRLREMANPSVFLGAMIALVSICLGAWYLIRSERMLSLPRI